jgi:hypothetical protein
MAKNSYTNPYRDESISSAISGLGGALFGHPEAINHHLDRQLKQQQLDQSQNNWEAENLYRQSNLSMQQEEARRASELHGYKIKNEQATHSK